MLGIIDILFALGTILVKWITISRLRDLDAVLLGAQASAMEARNRLKVLLNEKAGTERKITLTSKNNQAAERHILRLARELEEIQAQVEEQAEIARQKLALTEDLRRRSGPMR